MDMDQNKKDKNEKKQLWDNTIFSKSHWIIGITYFIYLFLNVVNTHQQSETSFFNFIYLAIGALFLIDVSLTKLPFFSGYFFYVIRLLELILLAMGTFFLTELFYINIFSSFLYVIIAIEAAFLFDLTIGRDRFFYYLMIVIPIITLSVIKFLPSQSNLIDSISFLVSLIEILAAVWVIEKYICKCIYQTQKDIFDGRRAVEQAIRDNQQLKIYQNEMQKYNEQLGIQKMNLELANREIQQTNLKISMQNQIIQQINSSLDINQIMIYISDSMLSTLQMDLCCTIIQNPKESKSFAYKVQSKLGKTMTDQISDLLQKSSVVFDFDYLREMYIDNEVADSYYQFLPAHVPIGSLLIHPLIIDNELIGIWILGKKESHYFNQNLDFYEAIFGQFVIALEHAILYSRMEEQAIQDALTGIYNRRYLAQIFQSTVQSVKRQNIPLSAVLLDIDKFKNVNDTYGHAFGDRVIMACAKIAQTIAERHHGIPARYGGEEFVILFPGKDIKETYPIIETMQKMIRNKCLTYQSTPVFFDASYGIASYPETCENPSDLLNHADWAMYYSKQNGRGRISIDSPEILKSFEKKKSDN